MSGLVLHEAGGTVARSEDLADGQSRMRIRIIEGDIMGSSGYYPASVIERDGPKAFPKGTHMHIDHQSFFEFLEKPAGSLSDLAGVINSTPVYEGDGLYAEALVFSKWAPMLKEMGPHIGVSIRAAATTETGTHEGEEVDVITELIAGLSVDFVTKPGANGRIVEILEGKPEVLPAGTKLVTSHPAIEAGTTGKKKGKPMAELTEETLKGFSDNIAALNVVVAGLTTKLTEAAAPPKVDKDEDKSESKKIDPTALILSTADALAESGLSAKSRARVLQSVQAGTDLTEAIKAETDFVAEILAEAKADGGVHVVGAGKAPADQTSSDNPFKLMEVDDKYLSALVGKVAG